MRNEYQYITPDGKIKTMQVRGHLLLVRRCKSNRDNFVLFGPENPDAVPFVSSENADVAEAATESLARKLDEPMCEVLAVGPDVGKTRSKKELKKKRLFCIGEGRREVYKDLVFTGEIGDFVCLPESAESGLMFRGVTGYEYDLLIDEGELQGAYVPKDAA